MYCRQLTHKDYKEFYTLSYKSFVERKEIGIDFDKVNFNLQVKNVLVNEQHHVEGLFENDILVGMAIVMFDTIPFSNEPIATFDIVHTDVGHRNIECYQLLLNSIFEVINKQNIKKSVLNSNNLLLEYNQKSLLLRRNKFLNMSSNWEKSF